MDSLLLTKFDVAERQFLQALRLFFQRGDPVSIHTLSEAANQVFNDIGKADSIQGRIRENDLVRDDKKKEWSRHLFKSRNFFKHADRDKCEKHEFKEIFNHFSLLEVMDMYLSFKKKWVPETIAYKHWFFLTYPDLLLEGDHLSGLSVFSSETLNSPDGFSIFNKFIISCRNGEFTADHICVDYGL